MIGAMMLQIQRLDCALHASRRHYDTMIGAIDVLNSTVVLILHASRRHYDTMFGAIDVINSTLVLFYTHPGDIMIPWLVPLML
jgi:hypothetical protein